MNREAKAGYLLVAPLVAVVGGLIAYPFVQGLLVSLRNKMIGMPAIYVGFQNYLDLLQDPAFRAAVGKSCIYTGASTIGKLVLGMVMALALNETFRGRNLVRGLLLIPWAIPAFVTAHTWRWIFDGTAGLLNNILVGCGVIKEGIAWLGTADTALPAVILAGIWRGFPFFGLILLGGMQAIPNELYEGAEIDGASAIQKFLRITVSHLKVIILLVATISVIWTFNEFPLIWIMTAGGPGGATEVLPVFAYKMAFMSMSLSRGTTAFILIFPLTLSLIFILSRTLRRRLD